MPVPVKCQCVFVEVQEHPNAVPLLEEIVLAPEGVEESAARAQFLRRPTGQSPGPAADGASLDANDAVRPRYGGESSILQ